jgi:hypothetical protein
MNKLQFTMNLEQVQELVNKSPWTDKRQIETLDNLCQVMKCLLKGPEVPIQENNNIAFGWESFSKILKPLSERGIDYFFIKNQSGTDVMLLKRGKK